MALRAVPPKAAEPTKPVLLVYGRPNVGKTTTALQFPQPYFLDVEGGASRKHYTERLEKAGGAYLGPQQGSNDFQTVLEEIKALSTEKHPYKTLVIDSISHLFGSEVANEQERMAASKTKDEYGASRKGAVSYMRRIVNHLQRLPMNVLLIAHEKDEYGMVDGKREVIGSTFDCWDKLEYILDLALNIRIQGSTSRAHVRKSRFVEFPRGESFPWSYDDFADRYGRDIIESEGKTLQFATPEQLVEIKDLMDRVRMPEDWMGKCLKRGNAEELEDMDADLIDKMIKMLREKMAA